MSVRVAINGFGRIGRGLALADIDASALSKLGVEEMIESTDHLPTRAAAARHLIAGAQNVILRPPIKMIGSESTPQKATAGAPCARSRSSGTLAPRAPR